MNTIADFTGWRKTPFDTGLYASPRPLSASNDQHQKGSTQLEVDYLNGVTTPQTDWLDQETRPAAPRPHWPDLGRSIAGVREAAGTSREQLKFEVFTIGGVELAVMPTRNYRALAGQGAHYPLRPMACWIATFCLLNDHTLLQNGSDFGLADGPRYHNALTSPATAPPMTSQVALIL
jgi:hypothetical protein